MATRSDSVPRTLTLARLSESVGMRNLARLLDQIGASARLAQQALGEEAVLGDQASIAALANAAKSDVACVGAAGLAARLGELEDRARRHELVNPLSEIEALLTELDTFLEALESRPERKPLA